MRVYTLKPDSNNYERLFLRHSERDWEILRLFDGTSLTSRWRPLEVELGGEDDQPALLDGDFPSLSLHIPVLSQKAASALTPLLDEYGEFLPLSCREGDYYAFNVTCLRDCLDVEHSEIVRFPGGRIMNVEQYAFHQEKIQDSVIFKLPQTPLMDVFVSERFISHFEHLDLKGMTFHQVSLG